MTSAACPACNTAPAALRVAELAEPNMTLSVPGVSCAACIGAIERGKTGSAHVEYVPQNVVVVGVLLVERGKQLRIAHLA